MFEFMRRSFRYVINVFIAAVWKLVFWSHVESVPTNLDTNIIEQALQRQHAVRHAVLEAPQQQAVQQEAHQQALEQTTYRNAQQGMSSSRNDNQVAPPRRSARIARIASLMNNQTNKKTQSKKSVSSADMSGDRNIVECVVCFESSVGRAPHTTQCGHIFCGDCIKKSIRVTKRCPLCNKALSKNNIFPVFL